ncbi:MAG: nucleoside hydrolase [Erysipelotrichaceae bacterium]|nr:nucleoside hydrolase [Erysipelotrichaceae bacterium]
MKKIIMDVDTGSDDALAIMLAILSKKLEVEAICSVEGSRPAENAADNTLRVLHLLNREDIPVYKGCTAPMVKSIYKDRLNIWEERYRPEYPIRERVRFHIDFDYLEPSEVGYQNITALEFYLDYLRRSEEKVTIVATGPLTNIGMLLRAEPRVVDRIEEIVVMGGGYDISNVSSSAEANFWRDPEAASIVINSGCNVLLVPLDATHKAYITAAEADVIEKTGNDIAAFAAKLIRQRILAHNISQPLEEPESAAIHDALALCYLLDPEVLRDVREVHCEIGLRDFSDGQTIIDPRYYDEQHNCRFAFSADRKRFIDLVTETFRKSAEVIS